MSAITDQIEEPPIHSSVTYSSCGPTVRPSEVLVKDAVRLPSAKSGAGRRLKMPGIPGAQGWK